MLISLPSFGKDQETFRNCWMAMVAQWWDQLENLRMVGSNSARPARVRVLRRDVACRQLKLNYSAAPSLPYGQFLLFQEKILSLQITGTCSAHRVHLLIISNFNRQTKTGSRIFAANLYLTKKLRCLGAICSNFLRTKTQILVGAWERGAKPGPVCNSWTTKSVVKRFISAAAGF